jgi:glyoxylase-like metal-dependent hydrolase (beta-lactamase superfamily II)
LLGHTPGDTSYAIESHGQKFLVWEDDNSEDQAEKEREQIFADAAKQGYWIGAAHISFPGLGHVGTRGETFVWIPVEYTARMEVPPQ